MDRSKKKGIIVVLFIVLFFLTNLPLIRVIFIHELSTILAIIGHAPNQFLFLPLFFPAAVWSTYKVLDMIINLRNQYPAIRNTAVWRWLVKRGGILVTSLLIGLSFATIDGYFTPPDFYQKEQQITRKAAKLNKQLIILISKAKTNKDKEKIIAENPNIHSSLNTLKNYYKNPANDRMMRTFEFIELVVVVFLVSLMLWMLYLNLRILGFSRLQEQNDVREELKGKIKSIIPYGVVVMIAYLFWPPLRLYNMYEIKEVIDDYTTIAPGYVYVFIAIQAFTLIWLYYSRLDSTLTSTLTAIASFLASGALMGFAHLTPQSLVYYIGSGMEFANLVCLTFSIIVFYIFVLEIFRQIREIRR